MPSLPWSGKGDTDSVVGGQSIFFECDGLRLRFPPGVGCEEMEKGKGMGVELKLGQWDIGGGDASVPLRGRQCDCERDEDSRTH